MKFQINKNLLWYGQGYIGISQQKPSEGDYFFDPRNREVMQKIESDADWDGSGCFKVLFASENLDLFEEGIPLLPVESTFKNQSKMIHTLELESSIVKMKVHSEWREIHILKLINNSVVIKSIT